jgi:small conductance mechanosensitive channel
MILFIAQLCLLADLIAAPSPAASAGQATVTIAPTSQPTSIVVNAQVMPTTAPAAQDQANDTNASALDRFKQTRLFELAEGKRTTTLHEMLQPGFWIDTIKELVVAALAFIPRLLVSILFLFVFWLIYRACRRLLNGAMQRAGVDPSIRDMMVTLTKWTIMGFGLVIACNQIGIPIVAMLTGVSILGLAVGFAAQETLANFIASIVIFWDKPFKVADWLTVDGVYGQVQRITFRSCRLLNLKGEIVIFPNTFVLSNKVTNHTAHPLSRMTIEIGIAYKESIDAARAVLLKTLQGDQRIRQDPAPEVVVAKCGESSVDLELRFWIDDDRAELRMTYEYNEKVKEALDAAGIEIPFPHMQLMVEQTPVINALAARGNGTEGDKSQVRVN